MVAATDTVFPTDLIRRDTRRVGLEREVDQFKHRLQVLAWFFCADLQVQVAGINLRQRHVDPFLRLLNLPLGLTNGFQILIQALTVMLRQRLPQLPRVREQIVQGTLA